MRLFAIVAVAAAGIVVMAILVWTQQRRLLYFPAPDPGSAPPGWSEVQIPTEDGLELAGWHRGGDGDSAPVVAIFAGNAGSRAGRVRLGNALGDHGYAVLLFDYRGYGGNPGSPSEAGLGADARGAYRYLRRVHPVSPLVYIGESLGTGVATGLAVEHPPDALILQSPFTSLEDLGRSHYPWAAAFLFRDSYPSLERFESGALDGIRVLVMAGTADGIVPIAQSRTIAEAAGAELYEIEGAGHNDPEIRSSDAVVARITEFIGQSIGDDSS